MSLEVKLGRLLENIMVERPEHLQLPIMRISIREKDLEMKEEERQPMFRKKVPMLYHQKQLLKLEKLVH